MKDHQLSYYTFKYRRVLRIPRSRQVSNNLMDGSAFLRTSDPGIFHLNPHSVLARSGSMLALSPIPQFISYPPSLPSHRALRSYP